MTEHLLDVRSIPLLGRHSEIFGTGEELAPGESIRLVRLEECAGVLVYPHPRSKCAITPASSLGDIRGG